MRVTIIIEGSDLENNLRVDHEEVSAGVWAEGERELAFSLLESARSQMVVSIDRCIPEKKEKKK
jgi:hypothetical protein